MPRRRRATRIAAAALIVLAALLVWFWPTIDGYAQTGAAYGARIGCSCRHVAGRPIDQCRADFEDGMGLVMLSEDAEQKTVTARFPLIASQTAQFRPGEGCVLQAWSD